ncbi:PEP-CTERM sorting domain-containing protein [Kiritimatiellota bacterium B12222]|nr:PEP-CTERM sorting domain-containing protein [Kiritimatiellota bacterium B12222]
MALFCASSLISGALIDSGLTGTTSLNGWEGLNNSYYDAVTHGGGYPGAAAWTNPMVANEGEADAQLMKVSGTAYPASSSLYTSGGAVLSLSDLSALTDLETIVFSIAIAPGTGGGVVTGPSLTLNGSTLIGAATTTWDLGSTSATIGGFEVTQTTYSYQWDLSGFGSTIHDFDLRFETGEHAQTYAMQLDQGDTYSLASPNAIPEPSSLVLFSLALWALFFSKRLVKTK